MFARFMDDPSGYETYLAEAEAAVKDAFAQQ